MKSYKWQEETEIECRNRNYYGLFAEMGTGKTKTMIDILRHKYNTEKKILPTIVFGPLSVIYNWKNEFIKWSKIDTSKIHVSSGNGAKRIKQLDKFIEHQDGIVIINYESLRSDEVFNLLRKFNPQVLVCDESHMVKAYNSLQSKKTYSLSLSCKYRFILTGTPLANSPMDIFQQYKIMDHGNTFGDNFFVFRSKYFKDANAAWSHRPNHFPKWIPDPDKFEELNKKVYSCAVRVLKKDCLDLPELIEQVRVVELSPKQKKLYSAMKKDFIAWIDDQKEIASIASIALVKALRLQQIVSGHLTDDHGVVHRIEDSNPRLDEVSDLLDMICPDHKIILWTSFSDDVAQLEALCKKKKLEYVTIVGGQDGKDRQDSIDLFNNNVSTRVCIANRRAGGSGISLCAASYSLVYSRNFSLTEEEQSKARNHRGGSEIHSSIVKIDLVAKDTIDEQILKALKEKKNISEKIIDYIRNDDYIESN